MDLYAFMELVGATLDDVAAATSYSAPTICRLRAGKIADPKRRLILEVSAWADAEARKRNLKPDQRLEWDWLEDHHGAVA